MIEKITIELSEPVCNCPESGNLQWGLTDDDNVLFVRCKLCNKYVFDEKGSYAEILYHHEKIEKSHLRLIKNDNLIDFNKKEKEEKNDNKN